MEATQLHTSEDVRMLKQVTLRTNQVNITLVSSYCTLDH